MKKKNINIEKEKKHVNQQNTENKIVKQKQLIISILGEINDPNIIKKIFTYVWTITH